MAQNITILGASYSAVPAVDLPKTGGGTARFTDVSGTTAVASDVASGKYFFDALGVLTLGTASGGGGGSYFTIETGTYTPAEDTISADISFATIHAKPPCVVIMADTTNTNVTYVVRSLYAWAYINTADLLGGAYPRGETEFGYGWVSWIRRTTGAALSVSSSMLHYPSNDTEDSGATYPRYWVRESGFTAYGNNTTTAWHTTGTYKWIALWKN